MLGRARVLALRREDEMTFAVLLADGLQKGGFCVFFRVVRFVIGVVGRGGVGRALFKERAELIRVREREG